MVKRRLTAWPSTALHFLLDEAYTILQQTSILGNTRTAKSTSFWCCCPQFRWVKKEKAHLVYSIPALEVPFCELDLERD